MMERGGPGEVVYVLLLVQATAGLLASVGELLLMGTPLYAALPVAKAAVLAVLAGKILRGRRWAVVTTIVLQWLGLLGVWLGVLIGLLPGLAPSITVVSLLTEVALPIAVILLCARLVGARLVDARLPAPPGAAMAHTQPLAVTR